MTANKFKEAMARVATGVSVLTCKDGSDLYGMTISSLTSVGLNPPTISVCVEGKSNMVAALRQVRRFGVTVLSESQIHVGKIFSHPQTPYASRFKEVPHEIINNSPLILGGLALLTCDIVHEVPMSENVVFFGRLTHIESHKGSPALYYHRNWARISSL